MKSPGVSYYSMAVRAGRPGAECTSLHARTGRRSGPVDRIQRGSEVSPLPARSAWATMLKWVVLWSLVAVGLFGGKWLLRLFYPLHFRQTVTHYAARHNLDPLLVQAIIRVESRYNPSARSSKGALGLMQLMPDTARWISGHTGESLADDRSLFDPDVNVRLGTAYLRELIDEYGGGLVPAMAAYNAGRGNVDKWIGTGVWDGRAESISSVPFPETRRYLQRVLATWAWYRRLYSAGSPGALAPAGLTSGSIRWAGFFVFSNISLRQRRILGRNVENRGHAPDNP